MFKVVAIITCTLLAAGQFSVSNAADTGSISPSITTPRIEPKSPDIKDSKVILPAPLIKGIPKDAEKFKFVLQRLDVEGAFGELAATLPDLYDHYIGQEISVETLFAIAVDIQKAYHEAGFFLVQVYVPAQTIEEGIARIIISEATLSAIDVSKLPERYQKKAKHIFASLLTTEHLQRKELERKLLLLNNLAGLKIESTLIAGDKPRSTVLLIEGQHKLLAGKLTADNFASDALRNENSSLTLSLNSPIGFGEQIIFLGSFHPSLNELGRERPIRASGQLAAYIPIGHDGLSLNADIVRSVTYPKGQSTSLRLKGRLNGWSAGLSFPFVLTRNNVLNIHSRFEYIDEVLQTDLTGSRVTLTHDSLRLLRFGSSWVHNFPSFRNNQFLLSIQLTQGLNALGARDEPGNGAALSRAESKVDFTKLDIYYSHYLSLPIDKLAVLLSAKAQISFDPLLVSQQFSLGGPSFGSGQVTGTVIGDYGFAVRGEIHHSNPFEIKEHFFNTQFYLFSDFGRAYLKKPTAAEQKFTSVADLGLGIRFNLFDKQDSHRLYTASFEYAKQFDGPAAEDHGHKLSFTLSVSF